MLDWWDAQAFRAPAFPDNLNDIVTLILRPFLNIFSHDFDRCKKKSEWAAKRGVKIANLNLQHLLFKFLFSGLGMIEGFRQMCWRGNKLTHTSTSLRTHPHPPPTLTLTPIHSHPQSHTLLSPYPSQPHSHIQNTHPHHHLCSPTLTATFTFTHKPTSTPAHLQKICTYKHKRTHTRTHTQVHTNTYRRTYKLAARHAFMPKTKWSHALPHFCAPKEFTHLLDQPL